MNIDSEYSKYFFDAWYDGFCNAMEQEQAGIVSNEGRICLITKQQPSP